MSNIKKRYGKDGSVSYLIRVSTGYDINGKQIRHNKTYRPPQSMSPKKAEKEVQRIAFEFEQECMVLGNIKNNIRFSDFVKTYLETEKPLLSPTTYDTYTAHINNFILPALGHYKLTDIKPKQIQDLINQLSTSKKKLQNGKYSDETLKPSTVQRYIDTVKSIFRLAVKQGLINDNPADSKRLTFPKAQKPKTEIFTRKEATELLKALQKEPLQFQTLIQLAIFSGARRGELVALKFSDIDFETRQLKIERAAYREKGHPQAVKPPKDYETRIVTLTQICCDLIKELQKEKAAEKQRLGNLWADEDWIFTQSNGKMMFVTTPTAQFSKFLEKYGFKHKKFHCLRHTSATMLLYAGANLKQVQSRLGHSDIETTNKYLHMLEDADIDAVDSLENLLSDEPNNNNS